MNACRLCGKPAMERNGHVGKLCASCILESINDLAEYRTLESGEIIQDGDEVNVAIGWNDKPMWVKTACAGEQAPDPACPSHRVYRRLIMMCPACLGDVDVLIENRNKCYPCPKCHKMIHAAMWNQFNESRRLTTASTGQGGDSARDGNPDPEGSTTPE